jgi:hypothetical protein
MEVLVQQVLHQEAHQYFQQLHQRVVVDQKVQLVLMLEDQVEEEDLMLQVHQEIHRQYHHRKVVQEEMEEEAQLEPQEQEEVGQYFCTGNYVCNSNCP